MVSLTLGVLLACMNVSPASAQVIHTESFDSTLFVPTGWSLSPSGGNPLWVRRTTGPNGTNILPHTGAAMARFTVAGTAPGTSQGLVTPPINYSGASGFTPTFKMWMYRDSLSTLLDSVTVFVNTTPDLVGATRLGVVARSRYSVLPNNELLNGWYQYTFTIPSTFNTSTNYIILNGTSQGGINMFVDDVEWDEYPMQCSGQPVAGTVSANKLLICGGSGDANLTLNSPSAADAGITITWQYSNTSTGPWTDFGTSSTTVNTGSISNTTFYRSLVTCNNSGLYDSTAALEITVSPNPNPVVTTSGNTVYCNGSSPITLTANGAVTYSWSPANGLNTTTGASVEASPGNNTVYTVTGTDAIGCTSSANLTVNVSNPPNYIAFANRSIVCPGDTTALRAQNQGGPGFGTQYLWTPGNLNGNNVVVTITAPITYHVVATNQAGCTREDSVSIGLAQTVNANFGYSITNQTVSFHDSSNAAVSWTWTFGDGNASFAQNPVYTYSAPGTYTVTLVVSNGVCTPDSISQTILISPTGLNEIDASNQLSLLPNPVKDKAELVFSSAEKQAELSVLNGMGQKVIGHELQSAGNYFHDYLDVSALPSGVYMVRIRAGNEIAVKRLIRQ